MLGQLNRRVMQRREKGPDFRRRRHRGCWICLFPGFPQLPESSRCGPHREVALMLNRCDGPHRRRSDCCCPLFSLSCALRPHSWRTLAIPSFTTTTRTGDSTGRSTSISTIFWSGARRIASAHRGDTWRLFLEQTVRMLRSRLLARRWTITRCSRGRMCRSRGTLGDVRAREASLFARRPARAIWPGSDE